jgi:hypothetical protein
VENVYPFRQSNFSTDTGPGARVVATDDATGEGGRGLQLVTDLATTWEFQYRDAGKKVWFSLADAGTRSPR